MSLVKCELCGREFKRIEGSHLAHVHKITMCEYKELYPAAKITSEETSTKVSAANVRRWAEDSEYREKMSKIASGAGNPSHRVKISRAKRSHVSRLVWQDEEYRKSRMGPLTGKRKEKARQHAIEVFSKYWESPKWRKMHSELIAGPNNPNWKNGASFEEYSKDFTTELKELVRERQGRVCFICGIQEQDLSRSLSVHHIDENKENNHPDNLVALCDSCHMRVHRGSLDLDKIEEAENEYASADSA